MLTEAGEPVALQPLGLLEEESGILPQDKGAIPRCLLDLNDPTILVNEILEDDEEVEINLFREFGESSGDN